jgi:hypothetical protein
VTEEVIALDVAMVTFDCADPDALAAWWAAAIAGEVIVAAPTEFVMVTTSAGLRLGFQKVPDPTPGKNRSTSICTRPTSSVTPRG